MAASNAAYLLQCGPGIVKGYAYVPIVLLVFDMWL